MCGIVGYMGQEEACALLMDALKKLEYRGYDSAGIAVWNKGKIQVARKQGKVDDLRKDVCNDTTFQGKLGLAHTRWATHGVPSERNAHPHKVGDVVVVHNGIIENYMELRERLMKENHTFLSDTDTEVIPHLIAHHMEKGMPFLDAVRAALAELKGSFAVGIIRENEDVMVAAKKESPLIVGIGDGEYYIASDAPAVLDRTHRFIFLEDGDMAIFREGTFSLTDLEGREVTRPVQTVTWTGAMAEKGGYKHFMLKEIFEQPRAISDTLIGRISEEQGTVGFEEFELPDISKLPESMDGCLWDVLPRLHDRKTHVRMEPQNPCGNRHCL